MVKKNNDALLTTVLVQVHTLVNIQNSVISYSLERQSNATLTSSRYVVWRLTHHLSFSFINLTCIHHSIKSICWQTLGPGINVDVTETHISHLNIATDQAPNPIAMIIPENLQDNLAHKEP